MNSVLYHLHPVKVKRHAVKVSYTLCLGGLSFFLFILLTVTGIFLMFFYRPTAAQAWNDIYTLQTSVAFGLLVRNMHRWAAHLMVLSVFLHMARVFYHGAYKPPREFNWVIGVDPADAHPAAVASPATCCPWDQLALWAVTVGTNMMGYTPVFGNQVRFVLLGGAEIGTDTLLRWYVLHVLMLPFVIVIFMADPLLAGPQGRRHLRAALGQGGRANDRDPRTPPQAGRGGPQEGGRVQARPAADAPAEAAAGGDAPQSEADLAHPRPPARAGQEGRASKAGGGDEPVAARPPPPHRSRPPRPPRRWPPPARRWPPAPAGTPSACSPSSSPARSRTSRPRRRTRCTSGRTCSSSSSSPRCSAPRSC